MTSEKPLPPSPTADGASIPRPPAPVALAAESRKPSFSTIIFIDPKELDPSSHAPTTVNVPTKPVFYSRFVAPFNAKFPKGKPVFGVKRSTFFMSIAAICYVLLACIVAMSVGLSSKSNIKPNTNSSAGQGQVPSTSGDPSGIDPKDTTDLPLPGGRQIFTGDATYYSPGLGSCGISSTDNDTIVAISHMYYDYFASGPNPNANPLCGRKVRATRYRPELGRNITIDATVVDRCTGCSAYDLDFSPYLFKKLAYEEEGRVLISWTWL